MEQVKTLIHVHTDYSPDSNISLESLAKFAREEEFGCIAVTDHDTIEGALRFRSMTDVCVVIGEEVSTSDGHLIGLFLEETVRPGMSALETAKAIRGQGGIVLLPHPFVKAFGCGLQQVAYEIAEFVDAVEVFNSQNLSRKADRQAERFAAETGLPRFVGADSHMSTSIAPTYQTMGEFSGPREFLRALETSELEIRRHPVTYFLATGYRVALELAGFSLPVGFGVNAWDQPFGNEAEPALETAGV